MTKEGKIHFYRWSHKDYGDGDHIGTTHCGLDPAKVTWTKERKDVTCKTCIKHMERELSRCFW